MREETCISLHWSTRLKALYFGDVLSYFLFSLLLGMEEACSLNKTK